jgi:hypothetical protein
MTTLSSAFKSSRRARTVRSVSLAVGCRETFSGVRRDARESAGVFRGSGPFYVLHLPPVRSGSLTKHNYLVRLFLPRRLWVLAVNLRFAVLFPCLLPLVLAPLDLPGLARRAPPVGRFRRRRARSAVEDRGDLRPWRNVHAGAFRSGREATAYSGIRTRARALPAGLAAA